MLRLHIGYGANHAVTRARAAKRVFTIAAFTFATGVVVLILAWPRTPFTEENARRDQILQRYFTPEAAELLQTVPLRAGPLGAGAGLSVGDDLGSRIAGYWWGFPWERQVIVVPNASDSTIFHEYVHQADYFGLIPRDEFLDALAQLKQTAEFGERVKTRERGIQSAYSADVYLLLALWYDDGSTKEMVAHLATDWVFQEADWPTRFMGVYAKALQLTVRPAATASRVTGSSP